MYPVVYHPHRSAFSNVLRNGNFLTSVIGAAVSFEALLALSDYRTKKYFDSARVLHIRVQAPTPVLSWTMEVLGNALGKTIFCRSLRPGLGIPGSAAADVDVGLLTRVPMADESASTMSAPK